MSRTKLLPTLLVILTLGLAACTASPSLNGSTSQNQNSSPIQAVAAAPGKPTQPAAPVSNQAQAAAAQVAASAPSSLDASYEAIYQMVAPSVVNITVTESAAPAARNSPFGGGSTQPAQALGSGFVWDTQGHIVTNDHVVSGAASISVTFSDGTTVDAKVVGEDANADLAVIQVNAPANLLVPVSLGETASVKVGEIAIAIGNPYGLEGTMTQGIVSGLARTLPVGLNSATAQSGPAYNIPDIIQTDAPINPGNSGGVLVDINGKLIGVTAAMESASGASAGIGFVIPTEIVEKVVPALIKDGQYQHPYLGISGTDLTPDLAKAMNLDPNTRGALIETVAAGGPAEKAGLLGSTQTVTINGQSTTVGGDIITAIDGQAIKSTDDLGSYLFVHTTAGQTLSITVLRGGKTVTLKATTGVMPTP